MIVNKSEFYNGRVGNLMNTKKLMLYSGSVQMVALLITFYLVIISKPIPDFLFAIFGVSMFTCIFSSLFLHRQNNENTIKSNSDAKSNTIISIILLSIPLVVLLIITHLLS